MVLVKLFTTSPQNLDDNHSNSVAEIEPDGGEVRGMEMMETNCSAQRWNNS